MVVRAYAVEQAGGAVRVREYEPAPLGPLEVDVDVTHCGVCHTDIGLIDDHYGVSRFPVVAGHEAVGVVAATGSAVDSGRLAVGQRVGVGGTAGACFSCEWCLSGRPQVCPDKVDTAVRGDGGAFATRVRAGDWRYVCPIPDAIASEHAAPLLCAGATVFAAMVRCGVRPTDHVAVVGLGGLGHLAVQFLAKWGCHVTVISSTAGKADDARRFGAHRFVTADPAGGGLAELSGAFDFVLSTVSGDLPWDAYLATLRPHGTLSVVGVPENALTVRPLSLLPGEKTLVGGLAGIPTEMAQMLEFAARHGIRPAVEHYPVSRIEDALDRVRHARARYRVVLEF